MDKKINLFGRILQKLLGTHPSLQDRIQNISKKEETITMLTKIGIKDNKKLEAFIKKEIS